MSQNCTYKCSAAENLSYATMSLLKSLAESGLLQPVNKGRYAKYKKKPKEPLNKLLSFRS